MGSANDQFGDVFVIALEMKPVVGIVDGAVRVHQFHADAALTLPQDNCFVT